MLPSYDALHSHVFCGFFLQVQLKASFKVRRLTVRIADAHGRLVRMIRLHYHTKPVTSLADLRLPENAAKWRLAASVHVRTHVISRMG